VSWQAFPYAKRKAGLDYTTAPIFLIKQKSPKPFPAFWQNARFDVNLPESDAKLFRIAYACDSVYLYIKNDEKERFFSRKRENLLTRCLNRFIVGLSGERLARPRFLSAAVCAAGLTKFWK
jgi:hypothetical protein